MIFVTIGSLLPFDRLIRAVDKIAPEFGSEQFFAQIGEGAYEPRNLRYSRWISRSEFKDITKEAKVILAHAGMGSIITAMELGKPIIILPRLLERGEHNTDHQMATARWLRDRPGVFVCMHEDEIAGAINRALDKASVEEAMPRSAPEPFVQRIRDFILS